ncbi:hypothetical protein WNY37_07885 [Henriciella sp. AS95]|uniref:hypothetical protein n=1 Tax=Henriciella sp. AS95 TaxID=3135782 RepID=UPI00316E607D
MSTRHRRAMLSGVRRQPRAMPQAGPDRAAERHIEKSVHGRAFTAIAGKTIVATVIRAERACSIVCRILNGAMEAIGDHGGVNVFDAG